MRGRRRRAIYAQITGFAANRVPSHRKKQPKHDNQSVRSTATRARRYGFWNSALAGGRSPGAGGQAVSLYDKRHDVEWLAPPVVPPAATLAYGAAWDGLGSYGWDE